MIIATDISICSAALLELGKDGISSFDEPNDRAKLCKNIYAIEKDSLLREHPWNCSSDRAVLAPMAAVPAFGFSAQFALPSNFLRLKSVGDHDIGSPNCMKFKVERKKILASGTMLPIEYVFRSDESDWDSKVVELMIARMVWKMAYPLTQSTSLRDSLADEYKKMAQVARSIDAQENPSEELSDDFALITGRF